MSDYASYRRGLPIQERFFRHVTEAVSGCWVWRGYLTEGYGRFRVDGAMRKAHRLAYEWFVAEIPAGLVLDHLCRNTACVNPWHLEPVPNAVNIARGRVAESNRLRAARITHCPQRHEYTPENTRVYDGKRKCLTCSRERALTRHYAARADA